MNLQPVQKRKLEFLEENIARLEKQVPGKGIWYAIRLSFIIAVLFYIVGFPFDYFTEGKSMVAYVNEYHPLRLLFNWLFWFLFEYFILVRGNQQLLRKYQNELAEAKIKYGLNEESKAGSESLSN